MSFRSVVKTRSWLFLCPIVGLLVFVSSAFITTPTFAAVGINKQVNFQGRLLNAQGATVPDGNYNIEFKIYQDGDGQTVGDTTGTPAGTLKWTEDWLNANSQGVQIRNGYLSVQLGSITPFGTSVDWNQDTLWLSLNIGSTNATCTPFSTCTPDGEMIPMKRLSSTPYAINSGLLGGLASSQFVQLAQGVQTEAGNTTNSIFINKTGTGGNFIDLQASGTDAFTLTSSGDVGFGNNANHSISVTTATAGVAGKKLTLTAGAAGSGATALAGGDLILQGGAGGGTNGNGGNITIDAGAKNGTGTDGVINIGTTTASAVNIATNASAHTIAIGNGGAVQGITIGSTNSTSSLVLQAGTGNLSIQTQGGTLGIGNNAVAQTIVIGNTTGTTGTTIQSGSSGIAINGTTVVTGNFTVSNAGNVAFQKGTDFATTGTSNNVNLGSGVLIRLTGATAQTITGIAGGVDGRVLTLVNAAAQAATLSNLSASSTAANQISTGSGSDMTLPAGGSVSLVYDSGASLWRVVGSSSSTSGFIQLQTNTPGIQQTGNFNISGTGILDTLDSVTSGTLSIGTVNAATINIATNASAHTIAIGNGGAVQGITIGSTNSTSSLVLQAGTGNLSIQTQGGTLGIGNNAVAQSLSIGNATGGTSITAFCGTGSCTFGAGAAAHTTTLGTTNTTATTNINAGTGGINIGTSAVTNTIQLGTVTGAVAQTIAIGNNATAASSTTVTIGNTVGGTITLQSAATINIGQNAAAQVLNLGNTTGATSLAVRVGTGGYTLDGVGSSAFALGASTTSGTITVGGTAQTGTLKLQAQGISDTITGSATAPSKIIKTSTNSATAFQVQNSVSSSVFGVDTTTNLAVLGQSSSVNGGLIFKNSSNTNGITLNSTGANSSYTLTLPSTAPSGGLCIETSTGTASQLVFASCSNNNTNITEVQEVDANNTNVVSITPFAVGDEIVLTTQIPTSGVTVSSVSGGDVGTWTRSVFSAGNGTVNRVEMWVGTVTSTGTANITVTYSSAPGAEEVTATEFTAAGVNASTSWGIESTASLLNSTASTTVTYPNLVPINGAELYIGYAQVQNPPAIAGSTSGFNYIVTSTQHNLITYNPSTTANTAYQPTGTQTTSGQSNAVAAVLTAFVTSTAINNATSIQKANFYVQAATGGSVAGVLQAASTGTADIFELRNSSAVNVATFGSTGAITFKNSTDSSAAFQIQNSAGNSILGVNTSSNTVLLGTASTLGGSLSFSNSTNANTITLAAPSTVAASYTLSLPSNTPTAGLCLGTSPSNATQLIFASCATQVSAASISFVSQWSNSGTSITTVADSPTSTGDLLTLFSHATNNVTITGVSGGGVTNWTKVTSNTNTTGQGNNEMWRGVVTSTGAATITITYSAAAGVNEITADEFTMGSSNGTWAVDTSGTAINSGAQTTINYPSLTPLNSAELYAGYAWSQNTMSAGTTTGFTYVATNASKFVAYNTNVSSGSAIQPTASQSVAGNYNSIAAVIAAYAGTSVIVNSTATQQANFNVQAATSGSVAGVLQAASTGTADIFQAKNGSGTTIASINASNGLSLGASGSIAGQLNFAASGNTNIISINAPSTPGASYTMTLPTTTPAAGQCLATSPSNANQLVFSSCANQVTSVAITFANSWKASGNALTTLSVSPASVGDLMVLFSSPNSAATVASVSGGGVSTWSKVNGTSSGSGSVTSSIEMWRGQVTTAGASTITVTFNNPAGNPNELAAMEFTTGNTNGSWVVDASNAQFNNGNSTTVAYPSLTPQSSKDLYVGYAAAQNVTSAGSTTGFTYLAGSQTNREGTYNTAVSATVAPTATQASASTSISVGALIAAYSSSSVISNSTVTQVANFNIQAATPGSVAGVLQAAQSGTADVMRILDASGTIVDSFSSTGNLLVQPSTASAAALQVQTPGAVNVFSVDTSNLRVVVGAGATGEATVKLLVVDSQTGSSSDPTQVNGAMYYNATTHTFRCGVDGSWQTCTGLLYSNTSASTANNNCTANCTAFSLSAPVPANYCQTGRVLKITANGFFSSLATASNLQFGIYYGTSSTSAASDTLLGTVSPAATVSSASNNYFQINNTLICYSTSSIQSQGTVGIQIGAAAAGLTMLPMGATTGTTVSTTGANNIYIFPIWDTASVSNTASLTQLTLNTY